MGEASLKEENLRQHRHQKEIAKQPSQNRVEVCKPDFSEKAQEKPKGEHRIQQTTTKFLPF